MALEMIRRLVHDDVLDKCKASLAAWFCYCQCKWGHITAVYLLATIYLLKHLQAIAKMIYGTRISERLGNYCV